MKELTSSRRASAFWKKLSLTLALPVEGITDNGQRLAVDGERKGSREMTSGDAPMSSRDPDGRRESTVRQVPLAMDAETFRAVGHRLVDQLAGLLDAVQTGPVTHDESPTAVREALGVTGPLPEEGTEPGALLEDTARRLFDHSLFNAHPRFFGYITSSPAPI